MASGRVEKDVVVGINYRLTLDDGTEVDSTSARGPMEYLHGYGNLIPGLEKALQGCELGSELDVSFPPDEAYGSFVSMLDRLSRLERDMHQHVHKEMEAAVYSYNDKQSFTLLDFDTTLGDPEITSAIVSIDGEKVHEFTLKRSQLEQ